MIDECKVKKPKKNPPHRPVEFSLEKALNYIMPLVKEGKLFTLEGICCKLDICTDTWYKHEAKESNKHLAGTIKKMKTYMMNTWIMMGLSGKVPTAPWIFCMKNMHGWVDKQEVHETGSIEHVMSVGNDYRKEQLELTLKARQLKIEQEQKKREAYEQNSISRREDKGNRDEAGTDGNGDREE